MHDQQDGSLPTISPVTAQLMNGEWRQGTYAIIGTSIREIVVRYKHLEAKAHLGDGDAEKVAHHLLLDLLDEAGE